MKRFLYCGELDYNDDKHLESPPRSEEEKKETDPRETIGKFHLNCYFELINCLFFNIAERGEDNIDDMESQHDIEASCDDDAIRSGGLMANSGMKKKSMPSSKKVLLHHDHHEKIESANTNATTGSITSTAIQKYR